MLGNFDPVAGGTLGVGIHADPCDAVSSHRLDTHQPSPDRMKNSKSLMDIEDICGCSKLPSIIPRKELPHLRSTSGECANPSNVGSFFSIDIFQFGQRRLDYWIFEFKFDFFFSRFIIISISKSWLYFSTDFILPIFLEFGFSKVQSVKIYGTREIFIYRTVSEFFVPFFFFPFFKALFFAFWHEVILLNLTWFLWKHHRCWLAPVSFFFSRRDTHTCYNKRVKSTR